MLYLFKSSLLGLFFVFSVEGACHTVCRILVSHPEIEPGPSAGKAQSLNHWTTGNSQPLGLLVFPLVSTLISQPQIHNAGTEDHQICPPPGVHPHSGPLSCGTVVPDDLLVWPPPHPGLCLLWLASVMPPESLCQVRSSPYFRATAGSWC